MAGRACRLHAFNGLTRRVEAVQAAQGRSWLSWYQCGPTVYDDSHIGHAVCFQRFDILRRIMQDHFGMHILQVWGMTDIDDKIIRRAARDNRHWQDVARQYEESFMRDMTALNVLPPAHITRVSEHMEEIVAFIQGIVDKGHAYATASGVYFDLQAFGADKYGRLGKGVQSAAEVGQAQRADDGDTHADEDKRHSADFALWKRGNPGDPMWDSPFGAGRPGWHIECSAMASKYLGSHIDIHSGGVDLLYPHHTNELAQCESFHGHANWIRHFWHTGHLKTREQKMSKSLGNTVSIQEFLAAHSQNALRMLCLQSRYRSDIAFSDGDVEAAARLVQRLFSFISDMSQAGSYAAPSSSMPTAASKTLRPTAACLALSRELCEAAQRFDAALCDDFNTPEALKIINGVVTATNRAVADGAATFSVLAQAGRWVRRVMDMLGFDVPGPQVHGAAPHAKEGNTEALVNACVELRTAVRETALATGDKTTKKQLLQACDAARDNLKSTGVEVRDTTAGSSWRWTT